MILGPEDHTFVVCAYKENPFLESTVRSLCEQRTLGKILISTSTPNEHIKNIATKFNIPMIVNPAPHLAGDDWNYGYDHAETPLVTLAHQDDIYEPEYLERVLGVANQYDTVRDTLALFFSDYYEIRNGEHIDSNMLLRIKRLMNAPLRSSAVNGSIFLKSRILAFGDSICCPSVTFVKSTLGESIFDTIYTNSCDYKTLVDLARKSGRFVYIPEKLVGHRIYAESATSRNLAENIRKKEDTEILETLWPRPIARLVNTVYALSERSNSLSANKNREAGS